LRCRCRQARRPPRRRPGSRRGPYHPHRGLGTDHENRKGDLSQRVEPIDDLRIASDERALVQAAEPPCLPAGENRGGKPAPIRHLQTVNIIRLASCRWLREPDAAPRESGPSRDAPLGVRGATRRIGSCL
jgi:hypothetical protein